MRACAQDTNIPIAVRRKFFQNVHCSRRVENEHDFEQSIAIVAQTIQSFRCQTRIVRQIAADIQVLEGGLVYQGTFAGRDDDSVSLGVAYGHINGRLINAQKNASEVEQSGEAVIELNYAAAVTPFFQLTPNLQIIVNPGADSDVPTALVLGLRSAVTF